MVKVQQVWPSASNPHSPFHCKHLKDTRLAKAAKEAKTGFTTSIAWLSYPKSVQSVKTDTSMTRIKKSQSSLHIIRRHTGQGPIALAVNLQKAYNTKSTKSSKDSQIKQLNVIYDLSVSKTFPFHAVGKRVCLVVLCKNPARRDKQWNYIALQFQRYTKHVPPIRDIYEHVDNVWGIPIPKRMVQKYRFLTG